ncbi:MAG: DUF4340 domain-containing protein [Saprospiraceae bacterium]|nr:MAG: DUF4340 domain-containing protein [Saprospiraceae bacterium]
MKKNYWLIIIFLLLGGLTTWYFLDGKSGTSSSNLGWDRNFKVEDPGEIQKIFIAKRNGITTTLERQGDHWMVNGTYKASPNVMENLLKTMTQLELKYVPPAAAISNIVSELGARGIKVEIFNKAGEKIKAYYVGGVTADARGTYMIQEGSEQPMVMALPMMDGQIRTRYDLTGDSWRDRTVFSYQPKDISAVSIEYPMQRNKSFKLKRVGNSFEVTPFYDNTPVINRPVDKSSVEAFLMGFKSLVAENFVNESTKKDSLSRLVPFSVISVTDSKGEQRIASLTQMYRIDAATGERKADIVERYHAFVNSGDLMLVQHRVFQKIFWPYEAFFQKEKGREVK